MSELENYFRDRSLDDDPNAGAYALAYAVLRLSGSLDGLGKTFAPRGLGTFDSDYFLVRLARRLDELAKQLGSEPLAALATRLLQQEGALDPPEAAEFLAKRRQRKPARIKEPDPEETDPDGT
ncbi:MAG TPA: hypothetical protein VGF39_04050 [Stellaceae bacterium]|jgi:hypothetical protein